MWRTAGNGGPSIGVNTQLVALPFSWETAMDLLFEKLRRLIIRAGEQILVMGVTAFYLIIFALLTIPDSVSASSLADLVWDQFSTPSPRAPAGDLTFWLLKIWAYHIVDVELPRFRNLFSEVAGQVFAARASKTSRIQTRRKLLHAQRHRGDQHHGESRSRVARGPGALTPEGEPGSRRVPPNHKVRRTNALVSDRPGRVSIRELKSGLPSEGETMNPVVLNYIILMLRNLRRNPQRMILIMLSTSLSLFVFTGLTSLAQRADGLVSQDRVVGSHSGTRSQTLSQALTQQMAVLVQQAIFLTKQILKLVTSQQWFGNNAIRNDHTAGQYFRQAVDRLTAC
jgi:hypothetical protein